MTLPKSFLLAAGMLVGASLFAAAQAQYPAFPYPYIPGQPPAAPQSWSYDPYTSGLGPCPQRLPGDPPCSVMMKPTYGQPNYWPTR